MGQQRGCKAFEARWMYNNEIRKKVEQAWSEANAHVTSGGVQANWNLMHDAFHDWDQQVLKRPKNDFERPKGILRLLCKHR